MICYRGGFAGFLAVGLLLVWQSAGLCQVTTSKASSAPGLGDPGPLRTITVSPLKSSLPGADAGLQLTVDGVFATGQTHDLTTTTKYSVEPSGIVLVDSTGYVTPIADGDAVIRAHANSDGKPLLGETSVSVTGMQRSEPVNFPNQIVPIFTKLGCNGGGCHGKLSGQNGFRLSLLGFEPQDDYDYLVKEARGRRLFPAAPEKSLLLLKATNVLAHGGGQRMELGSPEYRLIHRWISQGMPYGKPDDPTVEKIVVHPRERTHGPQEPAAAFGARSLHRRLGQRRYAGGAVRSECHRHGGDDKTGLVKTLELTGDVAVMARYQGQVDVFAPASRWASRSTNCLREELRRRARFGKLKSLGMPPSDVCDDVTFLRRVTVDIAGRLPTSKRPPHSWPTRIRKTHQAIDRLLGCIDYADYFANKWSGILRNKRG